MKLPPGYVAGLGVQKATAYGGLGQRLMEQMGWSKGQGLGKEKHGMKEAIEVKKKEDTLGVGANAAWNWEQKYWEEAYNSAITNINHETSGSSSSSDGSSSDTDSDGAAARRSGKRARKGTSPRSRSSARAAAGGANGAAGLTVHRDGTIASATAAELRIAAELAKDPWGRWGGRAGKMARIRAQEQEEANRARAKLGLPPLPVAAVPAAAAASDSDDSSSGSSSDDSNSSDSERPSTSGRDAVSRRQAAGKASGKKLKKEKKKVKETKDKRRWTEGGIAGGESAAAAAAAGDDVRDSAAPAKPVPKRVVVVLGSEAALAARLRMFATFKPTTATGWWGAKIFHSAGLLESLEDEAAGEQRLADAAERQAAAAPGEGAGTAAAAAGQRRGFNEDDQAAVYKRVHDFQRVGRRGLGKGEVKVGGAKWEGTKKTFSEEEEEDGGENGRGDVQQQQVNSEAGAPADVAAAGGEASKKEKKRRKDKEAMSEGADADAAAAAEGKPKERTKKERQHLPQQEGAATVAAAREEGEEAVKSKKAKRRKAAGSQAALDPATETTAPQQSEQKAEPVQADAAAAVPKPKWLKLARIVVKKSAERRVKLRKVVAELLQHAEEQHRRHHQHHHDHKHGHEAVTASKETTKAGKAKTSAAEAADGHGGAAAPGVLWDHDSVREVLERKIRKSNSGLAIDGKFLTMVGAT